MNKTAKRMVLAAVGVAIIGSVYTGAELNAQPRPALVRMNCVNPALQVVLHPVPNRRGRSGSYNVQFNVNTPAVAGTLFVDANNSAICAITSNRRVTGGRARILSSESEVPHAVLAMFDHVEQASPRFVIRLVPGTQSQGVVNIRFEVDYR